MINRIPSSLRLFTPPPRAIFALAAVALLVAGGFLALSLTSGRTDVAHAQTALGFDKSNKAYVFYTGATVAEALPAATGGTGTVTYSTAALPSWATFDTTNRQLTGTAPSSPAGVVRATLTATDSSSPAKTATITISIFVIADECGDTSDAWDNEITATSGSVYEKIKHNCNVLIAAKKDFETGGTASSVLNWSKDTNIRDWVGLCFQGDAKPGSSSNHTNRFRFMGECNEPANRVKTSDNLSYLILADVSGSIVGPIPPVMGNLRVNSLMIGYEWAAVHFIGLNEAGTEYIKYSKTDNNRITGPVPPEFANLDNTVVLSLAKVDLSSHKVPAELAEMGSMTYLYLFDAGLSGTIDSHPLFTTDALKKLNRDRFRSIYLNGNNLSGSIPDSLGEMTELQSNFWLQNNQLSGSIPASVAKIGSTAGSGNRMHHLDLSGNNLSGAIPAEVAGMKTRRLYLNDNNLTGPIPAEAGNSTLYRLWLHNNNLSGSIPPQIKDAAAIASYMRPYLSVWDAEPKNYSPLRLGGNALADPVAVSVTPHVVDEADLASTTFTATLTLDEGTAFAGAFHATDGQGNTLPAASGKVTSPDLNDLPFTIAKCDSSASPWTCTPNQTATVTFSLANKADDVYTGDRTVNLSLQGTGAAGIADTVLSGSATITIEEDDPVSQPITKSGVTVSESSLGYMSSGASTTYTVSLASQPSGSDITYISVWVRNTNANFSVSPTTHVFDADNWNVPKTFTVTAHPDNDTTDGSAKIRVTASIYKGDTLERVEYWLPVAETDVPACLTTMIDTDADTYRVTGQRWRWHTNASKWADREYCQSQVAEGNRSGKWTPARYYQFTIPSPARDVTVTMETDNLDAALFLRRNTKVSTIEARDANLQYTNGKRIARVRKNLSPGTYVIEATTPGWNQKWTGSEARVGSFKITVTGLNNDTDTSPECDVTAPAATPPPTDPGVPPSPTNLTWQDIWDGSCDSTWRKPYNKTTTSNARWYKFQVDKRALYTITLKSAETNAWLFLRSGDNAKSGDFLAQNDYDHARGAFYNYNYPWDARIQRWLDPGNYTVEATNWSSGIDPPHVTGPFTLKVKEVRLMPKGPPTATGATLALDGWNPAATGGVDHGDPWHYRADARPDAACSAAQTGTTLNLSGLSPNTVYKYDAYQDANCVNVIASTAFKTLAVLVVNDDWASVAVPEGAAATYSVKLRSRPSANVSVSIAAGAGDDSITVKDTDDSTTGDQTTAITFTPDNWSTARTVTLAAAEDADHLNGLRNIEHTASSSDASFNRETATLPAVEIENDQGIVLSPTALNVDEGGSATYTVKLSTAPTANVNVALAATGDADITFGPSSLAFTPHNYATAQTVTVHAAEDDNDMENGTKTITHTSTSMDQSYNSSTAVTLIVTEVDNDTTSQSQQAPASVGSVSASRSSGSIAANWNAPDGATKYHVTYTTDGGSSWSLAAAEHDTNSITIANADDAKAYTVGVRAGNDAGWSGWVNSNTVPAQSQQQQPQPANPPASVSGLSASRSSGSIVVNWDAPTGATKYHVTYTTDGGSSWSLAAANHTTNSITIANADDAKPYIVGVRAGNDAGWSGWVNSNEVPKVTPPPGNVTGLSAKRSTGGIVVNWDAPTGATKYHVTYTTDGGSSWSLAAFEHTTNSITIPNADDAKAYIVGVRAGNDAGWSGWVNSKEVPASNN